MKLHKWSDIKAAHFSPEQIAAIDADVKREVLAIRLRDIRKARGMTQAQVAAAAGMTQAELSRVERRGDWKLSTLRRVVAALGGHLHLSAELDGEEVPLEGGPPAEDARA